MASIQDYTCSEADIEPLAFVPEPLASRPCQPPSISPEIPRGWGAPEKTICG